VVGGGSEIRNRRKESAMEEEDERGTIIVGK